MKPTVALCTHTYMHVHTHHTYIHTYILYMHIHTHYIRTGYHTNGMCRKSYTLWLQQIILGNPCCVCSTVHSSSFGSIARLTCVLQTQQTSVSHTRKHMCMHSCRHILQHVNTFTHRTVRMRQVEHNISMSSNRMHTHSLTHTPTLTLTHTLTQHTSSLNTPSHPHRARS